MSAPNLVCGSGRKRDRRDTITNDAQSPRRQRTHICDEADDPVSMSDRGPKRLPHGAYTIGWLSALPIELAAARLMLEEIHEDSSSDYNDTNTYTLGRIGKHNVVIACLPSGQYGTNNAAIVATNMKRTFPSIEVRFMVGIGGGVPGKVDIRLGDVVVSTEVLQYDFGKIMQDGQLHVTSNPVRPPHSIMTAVSKLQSEPVNISNILSEMLEHRPNKSEFAFPHSLKDQLFQNDYEHPSNQKDCELCDQSKFQPRPSRPDKECKVHYGLIASGNQVMKHGKTRDYWARKDVLCFEMEAAGLMNDFPCLVIQGICDYADSHKNKQWQPYAAIVAAVYAKQLLSVIQPNPRNQWEDILLNPLDQTSCPTSLTKEQRHSLLVSLRFDQIDARYKTIKTAHTKTCEWLLSVPEYIDWLDSMKLEGHHGFLWIKGKPGTGKSTSMKFLRQSAIENMKDTVVINFFFNARGEILERSVLGMYRSLLLQLLTQIPALQTVFESIKMTSWYIGDNIDSQTWSVEILKDLLDQAIQRLEDLSVVCLVDALDECDQNEIRDMISYFGHLGEVATANDLQFRLCLSSRHYPHITVKYGLHLILEDQMGHKLDITNYVSSELKIGHGFMAEQIRAEVQAKASGVFMWVALVVEMLNVEHDAGSPISSLQHQLREIPGNLHELFSEILKKDTRHKKELLRCLQWILFARVPMKPDELYFAILCDGEGSSVPWVKETVPEDNIRKYLLSRSKGLAEVTKSKVPTVQFIHESIRDFLLKDEGIHTVVAGVGDFEGQSHDEMKRCCLVYIGECISSGWNPKGPLPANMVGFRESLNNSFPFLRYAVNNLLYHADKAMQHGISQKGFIENWDFGLWTHLHKIWRNPNFRPYTPNTRLLYVLAEVDAPHIIQMLSRGLECIQPGDEQFKCPLVAAMVSQSHGAVGVFRSALARSQSLSDPVEVHFNREYESDNNQYGIRKQHNLGIQDELMEQFRTSYQRSIISYVIEYGDEIIFTSLMKMKYFTPHLKDKDTGLAPISWAAIFGNATLVKMLLMDEQVDPNSTDMSGYTPLWWAATFLHLQVLTLLVETETVDVNVKNSGGKPIISWVIGNQPLESCVPILLKSEKLDLELRDDLNRTPLSWAASCVLASRIPKLLLDTEKVNLESKDKSGRTPLSWAASNGSSENVKLLLATREVNLNSMDTSGWTPLSWSVTMQLRTDNIKLLLEDEKVDPNLKDNTGRTPLSWAASDGWPEGIRHFLKTVEVDPNSRDNSGRTPLYWSLSKNRLHNTRLLLECRRVDPGLPDHSGRTPLDVASNDEIKQLLNSISNNSINLN